MAQSLQNTFDQVVNDLRKQGECSYAEGEGCMYESPDGLHCGIGIYLSDEALGLIKDEGLNSESVGEIMGIELVEDELRIEGLDLYDTNAFWTSMQVAHDSGRYNSDSWLSACEIHWEDIAGKYHLNYARPSQ